MFLSAELYLTDQSSRLSPFPAGRLQNHRSKVELPRHLSGREASSSGQLDCFRCRPLVGGVSLDSLLSASESATSPCPTSLSHLSSSSLSESKRFDLVTLSNLCVDVVVPMKSLPDEDEATRKALLRELMSEPPPGHRWEVGGNTNTLIAAARLGMRAAAVGHIGKDTYGNFLKEVLRSEGVDFVESLMSEVLVEDGNGSVASGSCDLGAVSSESDASPTLVCFVLVAPDTQHSFCSLYDFGPWPLLSFVKKVTPDMKRILEETAAVFVNGFVFDEMPTNVVIEAAKHAADSGAAIFFDPGPRSWTFCSGDHEKRQALESMLDVADVVLMTEEEAEVVTGSPVADIAARCVLERPGTRAQWCVIKRGADGATLVSRAVDENREDGSMKLEGSEHCSSDVNSGYTQNSSGKIYEQKALKVDVRDTVGCGDSFAAAIVLGYTRQHCIPATMALASAVGAATAMGTGAGRNVARIEDVEMLLETAVPDCEDGRHAKALEVVRSGLRNR